MQQKGSVIAVVMEGVALRSVDVSCACPFSSAQRKGEGLASFEWLCQHVARTLLEAMERGPWSVEMVVVQSELYPCSVCSYEEQSFS